MAVREVEVSAREEAMEARVNGGVAEHLDTMLAAQARHAGRHGGAAQGDRFTIRRIHTIEKSWRDTVLKKKQSSRSARGKLEAASPPYEKKLLERDFTLKRSCAGHPQGLQQGRGPGGGVRRARPAHGRARGRGHAAGKDVEKMVKDARSYERRAKKAAAGATKVGRTRTRPGRRARWRRRRRTRSRGPTRRGTCPPKKPPTPEPDFDPETEFFLTEAANLDPAVDATPDLPPGIDATPDASWAPNMTSAQKPAADA